MTTARCECAHSFKSFEKKSTRKRRASASDKLGQARVYARYVQWAEGRGVSLEELQRHLATANDLSKHKRGAAGLPAWMIVRTRNGYLVAWYHKQCSPSRPIALKSVQGSLL